MCRYFSFMFGAAKMNGFGRSKISRLARLGLLAGLSIVAISGTRTIYPADSQDIALKPLQLDPVHPGPRRVGELVFIAAWELDSDNEDFGGISALAALEDGRFVGLSDAGTLIGFGLTSINRIDRPFIAPLPDSQGPAASYKDRDSEGIAYDPQSGQFWISYEQNHAIRRFSRSVARMTGISRLQEMQPWPNNRGAECLVRLADGRFIAISESLDDAGRHGALLFSSDPVEKGTDVARFVYRPPADFRVTDCVQLPDGRLIVLNRRVGLPNGFAAELAMLDPAMIAKGETAQGKVIATLAWPLLVDNMEGIAVTRDGKDTLVWLISDNNFSIFQRTLLMKFRLSERTPKKKPEAAAPGFDSL
jgi:hypothetical protein